jgi:hypothetical protein
MAHPHLVEQRTPLSGKEPQGGCAMMLFFMVIVGLMLLVSGCHGPKTYEFYYVVDVRYTDGTSETLEGNEVHTTDEPEKLNFSLSSRLRKEPCLVLGWEGTNVACFVKSFKVLTLTYKEVKHE